MNALATWTVIAMVVSFAAGCASSQYSGSLSESDRVWCQRGGGTWKPALGVCESPGKGP